MKTFLEWLDDLREGNIFNRTPGPLDAIASVRGGNRGSGFQQLDRPEARRSANQVGLSFNDNAAKWLRSPEAKKAMDKPVDLDAMFGTKPTVQMPEPEIPEPEMPRQQKIDLPVRRKLDATLGMKPTVAPEPVKPTPKPVSKPRRSNPKTSERLKEVWAAKRAFRDKFGISDNSGVGRELLRLHGMEPYVPSSDPEKRFLPTIYRILNDPSIDVESDIQTATENNRQREADRKRKYR